MDGDSLSDAIQPEKQRQPTSKPVLSQADCHFSLMVWETHFHCQLLLLNGPDYIYLAGAGLEPATSGL